ncbi:iron-sulfur cluster carrier protein ApbC [Xenorhabdus bovienii]|uniref:Iron-sulfur cluster carrier protein n=1 Tax=Xenorhabdus bovienii TaxID=40576 RepID=A0AAJ1MY27_XENBV|nr:iron-sulfur cluster carrier protein ApbC [Xenorhabdus bovienii]MDE1477533.1 iron-sulfur cluster carrier protein ApbC [Xenorhabdus bovienii]MDE1490412.1 iron-sulfur cluster carrier protein ApbC [Xenorhabdus bovienii]MDE9509274.1 iron-sulfur cluster carrier protein ApbC [Xenorhabdus bovienii]MDE9520919.1 iron-sulfur cluster carrier protein ApbC [Xenorhabdus bovienii]MDE9537739.1 iron-sulfur cluster carrier protein ApbC [Xenorhabdus bovienii]
MNSQSPEQTSPDLLKEHVVKILATFKHPTLERDLIALKALHHCAMLDGVLHIELMMPFVWKRAFAKLKEETTQSLQTATGAKSVDWRLTHDICTLRRANNLPGVNGVRNILAVSSGKGGVGKSSTAVNLALALAQEGAKVGILDADIYGPSVPNMLGTAQERPTSPDGQHMAPIMVHGMATNSIGYLVTDDNAMIWRGPMASKALMQMLQDTLWPDLDYLVIDMPPGTGDIQLTLSQNIPVTGALVITTPQDIALIDAIKGIAMFQKVNVPVLGIIENMSIHICSNCGHQEPIFGTGGAEKLAEKYHCQLLGQIPLHISLREDLDRGEPTVISQPDSELADIYRDIAANISAQMYWQGEKIPTEISFRAV